MWIYSRGPAHADGQTFERRWSRTYNGSICELAETLLCRSMRHDISNAEVTWNCRIWPGKRGEQCVGDSECAIRTRGAARLPKRERYQVGFLKKVIGTPWQPHMPEAGYPVFVLPIPSADVPSVVHVPRRPLAQAGSDDAQDGER